MELEIDTKHSLQKEFEFSAMFVDHCINRPCEYILNNNTIVTKV